MTDRQRARSRIEAFRYAFSGWWYVLRTQRNAWLHAIATVVSVALGIWLQLERLEWALLVLAIGMVWLSEFINSSLKRSLIWPALRSIPWLAWERMLEQQPFSSLLQQPQPSACWS